MASSSLFVQRGGRRSVGRQERRDAKSHPGPAMPHYLSSAQAIFARGSSGEPQKHDLVGLWAVRGGRHCGASLCGGNWDVLSNGEWFITRGRDGIRAENTAARVRAPDLGKGGAIWVKSFRNGERRRRKVKVKVTAKPLLASSKIGRSSRRLGGICFDNEALSYGANCHRRALTQKSLPA